MKVNRIWRYLCGELSILWPFGLIQYALVEPSESVHDTKYVSFMNFFTTFSLGIISTCWPLVKLSKPGKRQKRREAILAAITIIMDYRIS